MFQQTGERENVLEAALLLSKAGIVIENIYKTGMSLINLFTMRWFSTKCFDPWLEFPLNPDV